MRKTVLAVLLAAGAAMPMTAMAQEAPHERQQGPDHPGGGYHGGGHPGGRPGAQAPRPAGQPPVAPGSGGYRPQPGQPGFRDHDGPPIAPGSGGYRPQPGQPGFRDHGGPPIAPGSGGYRPQPGQPGYRNPGGPMIAPGSGGYRPQPGQYGYHGYRPDGPGARPAPPPPRPGGGWNRGWRGDDRFDYRQYRAQNNFIFRLGPYEPPRGWGHGYRRFSPGFTIAAPLFEQGFWIDDPFYYRLPPAWGPYRWVRYYDDALLVDVRTGLVVDAVYGLFW